MNIVAIFGLMLAVAVMLAGIMMGAPLIIFIDPPSMLIGPFATVALLVATFGFGTVCSAFDAGFRGMFQSADKPRDPEKMRVTGMVATSGINYSMLTGFMGGLIGLVQMLQNMSDPSAIGPAMAVCLLSAFYAAAMVMFVYYPMARVADRAA